MENARKLLDIKLLSQSFNTNVPANLQLEDARSIAKLYMRLENCISVLSDLKARKSYLYYGAIAEQLGLEQKEEQINSIWEDELLNLVHAQDLQRKYQLEFQFFQLLHAVEAAERVNYSVTTKLRVKNRTGKHTLLKHRLFYISSSDDGNVWLALCLYNVMYDHPEFSIPEGVITNTKTGEVISCNQDRVKLILTMREKEVLQLVKLGHPSKEIAGKLQLSLYTVNRHRQNIFQKLNVANAMEACRVAESLGLI